MRKKRTGLINLMNRFARIGLVLVLTMVISALMPEGWYQSTEAEAAVGYGASSEFPTGTTGHTGAAFFSWTHAGGASPRGVLVYVFTYSTTDTVTSVTYGGITMDRVAGGAAIDTVGEPMRTDTFFLGASVPTGNQTVRVNRTNTTTVMYGSAITVTAAYDTEPTGIVLLQENGTYTEQSVNDGSPGSNSMRFVGAGSGRNTTALGVGASTTSLQNIVIGSAYSFNTARETTAGQGARNVGFTYATSDDRAAVHLAVREIIPTLTIGEGTNPANANAPRSSTNNALDGFTMVMNGGTGTVNSLTVTGSANFTATNIPTNGVKVWRDAGTVGVRDGADVQISTASSAIAGNATTLTISSEPVTTTAQNYLVTVDITAGATLAQTFTATISAAGGTGLGTPVDSDAASALLTVSAVQNLTVGNGTNPSNANVLTGSRNNALDAFTLALSAGSGNVGTLTLTGSANFTSANISGINVYRDNGTVGTFDGADVLVPTTYSHAGNTPIISFASPEAVTTASVSYLVLVDFSSAGTDGSFTATVTGASGSGLSAITYSDSSSATLTTKHPSGISSCSGCHGDASLFTDATTSTSRGTPDGAFVGDHNAHVEKLGTVCSVCHVAPGGTDYAHRDGNIQMQSSISGGSYSKTSPIAQVNNPTTGTCSNISCHGANSPTPQWGVGTAGCVDCHAGSITRTQAAGTLDNVVAEFGLAWGHKKAGRGTVTNADCIVCHLEGNYTTQGTSTRHMDGNIDLRDPDGAGETPITNVSGAGGGVFTFTKFSTTYNAGTRYTDGHTRDTIDNVLTQKFCLACHDSDGATNPTTRTAGGTQYMPWGGVNLGANYTVANGVAVAGGLVDVKTQTLTSNSSFHPIQGPKFKGYPTSDHMVAPYNNYSRTAGTKSNGVVMNCFDCHNAPVASGGPFTNRTVVAHGNANTLRGTVFAAGPTLCYICHTQTMYSGSTNFHSTGSAWGVSSGRGHTTGTCHNCHGSSGSGTTGTPGRPIRAFDYHGFNKLLSGANWPTNNARPFTFIRNTYNVQYANPASTPDYTGSAGCQGKTTTTGGTPCGWGDMESQFYTYTPGGQY